jgi:hypothetical protein
METQQPESTLVSHAAKTGVILGVASIILTAILYAVDESVMVHWAYGLIVLLASIVFVVLRGIGYRKSRGGFMGFGDAWKHGFISFAVSAVLGTLFSFVLYTVIDPELGERLTEVSVENAMDMAASFGAPEESLSQMEEDTRTRMEGQFTAMGLVKGLGINLIVIAVISLITALIVRKQEKVQDL